MGQLQLDNMLKVRISRERVFSQLRGSQVKHLGEVDRLYLEANGSFTVVKRPKVLPGLCVLPEWDNDLIQEQVIDHDHTVCGYCGHGQQDVQEQTCPQCKQQTWVKAIH
jgi:uncharacterized membrane protein YcaP (DUF421 family)